MHDGRALRRLGAGAFTFLATAVAASFVIAMGLVVTEFLALPLNVLVAVVIAALVASWAGGRLATDEMRTDINRVVTRKVMAGPWSAVRDFLPKGWCSTHRHLVRL